MFSVSAITIIIIACLLFSPRRTAYGELVNSMAII